jgi:hypothetical protein
MRQEYPGFLHKLDPDDAPHDEQIGSTKVFSFFSESEMQSTGLVAYTTDVLFQREKCISFGTKYLNLKRCKCRCKFVAENLCSCFEFLGPIYQACYFLTVIQIDERGTICTN